MLHARNDFEVICGDNRLDGGEVIALADEAGLVLNTVTLTERGGTSTLRLELEWRGESFTVETVL